MKPYCYDYPHPAVTTDIALFTIRDERLAVLLIRRARRSVQGLLGAAGRLCRAE